LQRLGGLIVLTMIAAALAAAGVEAQPTLKDENTMVWEGRDCRPLDEEGVYWYETQGVGDTPMPVPRLNAAQIIERFGMHPPVRLRLLDWVDCSKTDHGFKDRGKSRVIEIGGTPYRVTSPDSFDAFWYYLKCQPTPGKPHLVVAQLINDRERYTTVSLTVPEDSVWAAPYAGEEEFTPENQEGHLSITRDIGGNVYTGREYPTDGRPFYYPMIYYPWGQQVRVTVTGNPNAEKDDPANGAAVARLWIFDILDPLSERLPTITPPDNGPERRIGLYMPHAWYLIGHYGVPSRTPEERRVALNAAMDYLRFCGLNTLYYHAINGSDMANVAWYHSQYYDMNQADLFQELLPLARDKGITVVPILAPLNRNKRTDQAGWSDDSLQIDYKGGRTLANPDPLRPEVQDWFINVLVEMAEKCRDYPNVPGIAFRVNGKIGTCYAGSGMEFCGQYNGYSPWDLAQFKQDTGLDVPARAPQAYQWLRDNAWDRWIDWRCQRMHDLWVRARDAVQAVRRDYLLIVQCDLPSEWPGYNIEWVNGTAPRELMRHHGYDPVLFKNEPGILISRGMMINADRFWGWAPPNVNAWAHKAFNYAPGVIECYQTPAGQAVEFYHNYWEEGAGGDNPAAKHPDFEFGDWLRTATGAPLGRYYYEPVTYSIRAANVNTMLFMAWERASIGHEHDLRRFAKAFRALPMVEPRKFEGTVEGDVAEGLSVSWYDDRLGVINDTGESRRITISWKAPRNDNWRLFDLSTDQMIANGKGGQISATLTLDAHDLKTLMVVW
jgi:hypothetical protein